MTTEEVREYIDSYILHIISMVEYGNWFAGEIEGFVSAARKEAEEILERHGHCHTKKACRDAVSEIRKVLDRLESELSGFIEGELPKIEDGEWKWLKENVGGPLGLNLEKPSGAVGRLVLIPVAAAGIVGRYGKTVSGRLKDLYEQKVMQSYVTGTDFADIDFSQRFGAFERGLEADSETLGSSLPLQYDRIVYTKNDDVIPEYMWLAILDGRTCLVCASLDHTRYRKIEDVPLYARHDRCRCSVLAVTPEMLGDIPKSYGQWFEARPKAEKYRILGRERFRLYENGMKIRQFVNNGKKTPLKDLHE